MIIIDYQYKKFSEINHLNNKFIQGVNKLKLTIDTISSPEYYKQIHPAISNQFKLLFPNLKNHQCCNQKGTGVLKLEKNYVLDVIHLIEHVIIDIQCAGSKMKICSGITCNYFKPTNRYDIFVECVDKQVGYFASQLAIDLVQQLLNNNLFSGNQNELFNKHALNLQFSVVKIPTFSFLDKSDYPSYLTNYIYNNYNFKKN